MIDDLLLHDSLLGNFMNVVVQDLFQFYAAYHLDEDVLF